MSRLREKYKKAEKMVELNNREFAEIDARITAERRVELENMERRALEARIERPDAMDIFDVQMAKRMFTCWYLG